MKSNANDTLPSETMLCWISQVHFVHWKIFIEHITIHGQVMICLDLSLHLDFFLMNADEAGAAVGMCISSLS